MDVFVIPVARDRYELYCESSTESEDVPDTPSDGLLGRMRHRFALMMKAAEQRRHRDEPPAPQGWLGRIQDRMLAWVAERIAEQRLLWNLRKQTEVVLAHPQDMTFEEVVAVVRRRLQHDYERHRLWLVLDSVLLVASAALALLPGPNIVAYYFIFRVVGHWLSMRGARQGLDRVTFSCRPCPPLTELRELIDLEPAAREERIHDIAGRLRLRDLTTFFERVAIQS
jgi:hypothetical protein